MYNAETMLARLLQLIDDRGGQTAVSCLAGVPAKTLRNWSYRESQPNLKTLAYMLSALRPTAEELLWMMDYEGEQSDD